MYTKLVLKKLGFSDIFAYEGEIIPVDQQEFKADQSQYWRNLQNVSDVARQFNSVTSTIGNNCSKPNVVETSKVLKIEKLNGPYVKDFSKFQKKANEDFFGLIAVGFCFLKGVDLPIQNMNSSNIFLFIDRLIEPRSLLLGDSPVISAFAEYEQR